MTITGGDKNDTADDSAAANQPKKMLLAMPRNRTFRTGRFAALQRPLIGQSHTRHHQCASYDRRTKLAPHRQNPPVLALMRYHGSADYVNHVLYYSANQRQVVEADHNSKILCKNSSLHR